MKPRREHATNNAQTYFVTSNTWGRRALFCAEPWARSFFKNLLSYRDKAYLLHEFVLMPEHFHLLITPLTSLERAVQFVKGGFSYGVKIELGSNMEVWQPGFDDHRIRDAEDYDRHMHYIWMNPVKRHLCERAELYPYCSKFPGWRLDPVPQRLKPGSSLGVSGTAKAVPCQNKDIGSAANAAPCQSKDIGSTIKAAACQSKDIGSTAKAAPCHSESREVVEECEAEVEVGHK